MKTHPVVALIAGIFKNLQADTVTPETHATGASALDAALSSVTVESFDGIVAHYRENPDARRAIVSALAGYENRSAAKPAGKFPPAPPVEGAEHVLCGKVLVVAKGLGAINVAKGSEFKVTRVRNTARTGEGWSEVTMVCAKDGDPSFGRTLVIETTAYYVAVLTGEQPNSNGVAVFTHKEGKMRVRVKPVVREA